MESDSIYSFIIEQILKAYDLYTYNIKARKHMIAAKANTMHRTKRRKAVRAHLHKLINAIDLYIGNSKYNGVTSQIDLYIEVAKVLENKEMTELSRLKTASQLYQKTIVQGP